MILSCQNISKAFDGKEIIKDANFHIEDHEKAAIVGINGAGKTTLLNMITGKVPPDDGIVALSRGKTMGYLEQHPSLSSDNTIYDELMSVKAYLVDLEKQIRNAEKEMQHKDGEELEQLMNTYSRLTAQFESENGYAYKSELTGVLKGLGFVEADYDKPINTLSGGQKTRVALGKMLLLSPDLILLDEPTNHLDMNAIAWLETYLINYKGAVLIVSHDRYFLNRIAQKIIEVDMGRVMTFTGNYSDYAAKKEQYRITQMNAYLNQQREIKHQQEVIDKLKSFNREKSIKRAESREKLLSKVEVLEKPSEARADMHLTLTPNVVSGNDVMDIEHLTKSYDDLTLFEDLNISLKRGEHVAIIGDNGTGKTTILKLINNLIDADNGTIKLGTNVHIGYYDQEHHVLHMDKTIYDEISDDYPYLTITQIRNILAAFLFTGDDVFKLISECSGGERGRISLAKLMLSEANFLILDEPTNHLDITSKEILENALNHYEGTVLYVSHDRYFVNKTAHRILELENQKLTNYLGNYDYYLEKKMQLNGGTELTSNASVSANSKNKLAGINGASVAENTNAVESAGKTDWKAQKEEQARLRKLENDLKKTETRIEEVETRIAEIDELMASPEVCTDVAKLTALSKEQGELQDELGKLYETWESLSEM